MDGGCPVSRIYIEVDAKYQALADAFMHLVATLQARQEATPEGAAVDYGRVEQEVAQATAGLERAAHAQLLQDLDVDAPQVVIAGQPYRKVMRSLGSYYTLAGPVQLERTLYRKLGERAAATVDAISLRSGALGEGWLPKTAEAMAWECQRAPAREAEAATKQWQRLPYSRCAFERVAHLVAEHYGQRRQAVERELVETMPLPKEAHSVSVSLDRVSVPMEEPRPGPQEYNKKGTPKRMVQRVYRMAYAATVTLHDNKGNALHTLRYGRMPKADVEELCEALSDDVMTLVRACPSLLVVLLCDGAKELWNELGKEFTASSLGHPVHRLVDLWHLLEKLGSAAKVLYGEAQGASALAAWRLLLLNQSDAVEQILKTLKASGKEQVRVGEGRPVHEAITYLKNHRADMEYAKARRLGLPIGSGNVEATCKSLFEVRLKRPGCRWKESTGAQIVDLRALALSDRYTQAIGLALAPLRASVSPVTAPGTKLSCAA